MPPNPAHTPALAEEPVDASTPLTGFPLPAPLQRPILLTVGNGPVPAGLLALELNVLDFAAPAEVEVLRTVVLTTLACGGKRLGVSGGAAAAAAAGGQGKQLPQLLQLVRSCGGDLRRSLLAAQFWAGAKGGSCNEGRVEGGEGEEFVGSGEQAETVAAAAGSVASVGGADTAAAYGTCVGVLVGCRHALDRVAGVCAEHTLPPQQQQQQHEEAGGLGSAVGSTEGGSSSSLLRLSQRLDSFLQLHLPPAVHLPSRQASVGTTQVRAAAAAAAASQPLHCAVLAAGPAPSAPGSLPREFSIASDADLVTHGSLAHPLSRQDAWLRYHGAQAAVREQQLAARWEQLALERALALAAKRAAARGRHQQNQLQQQHLAVRQLAEMEDTEQTEQTGTEDGGVGEQAGGDEQAAGGEQRTESDVGLEASEGGQEEEEAVTESNEVKLQEQEQQQAQVQVQLGGKRRAEGEVSPVMQEAVGAPGADGEPGAAPAKRSRLSLHSGPSSAPGCAQAVADEGAGGELGTGASESAEPTQPPGASDTAPTGAPPSSQQVEAPELPVPLAPLPASFEPVVVQALSALQHLGPQQQGSPASKPPLSPVQASAVRSCRTQAALAEAYDRLSALDVLAAPRDVYAPVAGARTASHHHAYACVRPMGLGTNMRLSPPEALTHVTAAPYGSTPAMGCGNAVWVVADALIGSEDVSGPRLGLEALAMESGGQGSGEPAGPVGRCAAAAAARCLAHLANDDAQPPMRPTSEYDSTVDPSYLAAVHSALLAVTPGCGACGAEEALDRVAALAAISRSEAARKAAAARMEGRVRRVPPFRHYLADEVAVGLLGVGEQLALYRLGMALGLGSGPDAGGGRVGVKGLGVQEQRGRGAG